MPFVSRAPLDRRKPNRPRPQGHPRVPTRYHPNINGGSGLSNPDFVTWVRQTLAHAQFPSDRLVLEITGTCLTGDDDTALANLRALIAIGIRIHLDNVGIGLLSLDWLHDGLLNSVKLDRVLITRLDTERGRAITAGVIATAHGAGCSVIAEGVETEEELEHLRRLHCDAAQGHHIAAPTFLHDL
jgi:EAL domain-containing protein (putative c-di-GMP-specific phosphodiesterase class I)